MRSSMRRSTPLMGDDVQSSRAAWTTARALKSELRFTSIPHSVLRGIAASEGPKHLSATSKLQMDATTQGPPNPAVIDDHEFGGAPEKRLYGGIAGALAPPRRVARDFLLHTPVDLVHLVDLFSGLTRAITKVS